MWHWECENKRINLKLYTHNLQEFKNCCEFFIVWFWLFCVWMGSNLIEVDEWQLCKWIFNDVFCMKIIWIRFFFWKIYFSIKLDKRINNRCLFDKTVGFSKNLNYNSSVNKSAKQLLSNFLLNYLKTFSLTFKTSNWKLL